MQGITYSVDLVLVIDATGSMGSIINRVKENALGFHSALSAEMETKGKEINQLRLRVIATRDQYVDGDRAVEASEFFTLPQDQDDFARFVNSITAQGGGDEPETTLEALALAMQSKWDTEGTRRRQVIVVWTDASCHPLEKNAESKPRHYPPDMPADFNGLTDMWEGQSFMEASAKRLLIFAPDAYAWTDMATYWSNTLHYASKAGEGLSEVHFASILDAIAASV